MEGITEEHYNYLQNHLFEYDWSPDQPGALRNFLRFSLFGGLVKLSRGFIRF